MKYFVGFVIFIIEMLLVSTTSSLQLIYAVNAGGDQINDTNGISYAKDTNTEGASHIWYKYNVAGHPGINFHRVSDNSIYNTARYAVYGIYKFGYNIPVEGDGSYGLILHFSDDSIESNRRLFDVQLNGEHKILSNYDIFKECGLYNICNEIIYFSICEGVLWFNKQQSTVVGNTIRLQFETISKQTADAVISGIVLYKGQLNEGKEIFGTKIVLSLTTI
jgi:hypothetical protein